MRTFVTGGTGLLGGNIIKDLISRNHQVAALVRSPGREGLFDPAAHVVKGDLRDVSGFEQRLSGIDVLIHAAACYGEYYRTGKQAIPHETNVQGTIALLKAAYQQGVRNVVYISSAAVLETRNGRLVDESSPYAGSAGDPYFRSKVYAEKAVLDFQQKHPDMRIVILLPTVMLGPGDGGPSPTGAFILKVLNGAVKFILPGWHRIVDVRDVARAAVEAIQKGTAGERYVIGGRRYSVAEIYQTLTQVTGIPTPVKTITPKKLLFAARLMTLVSKVTRRQPPLKPNIVKRLQDDFTYSSAKAEREFGVRFRPLSETLADAAAWFQKEGML